MYLLACQVSIEYMCMHTCLPACIQVQTRYKYARMHAYKDTEVCESMHKSRLNIRTCIHVCLHTYRYKRGTNMHECMLTTTQKYVKVCINQDLNCTYCAPTYTCAYIHYHIYSHICTCMYACM